MINRRMVLVSLLLFFMLVPLFSLTVQKGKIQLVLHEEMGRYSLYYLKDAAKEQYVPLFLAEDPSTSTVSVIANNRIVELGNISGYTLTSEETAQGARFTWTSSQMEITQDFTLISSVNSSLSDGVKMTITVKNLRSSATEIGIKILWDTTLGENADHFLLNFPSRKTKINSEFRLTKGDLFPLSWQSTDSKNFGMMTMLSGNVTIPETVLFANWKRLNDAAWSYSYRSGRNFNQMPYYINDSAVLHLYEKKVLNKDESYTVTAAFGYADTQGFTLGDDTTTNESNQQDISQLYERAVTAGSAGKSEKNQMEEDLLTLKDLISQLDYYSQNIEEMSDTDLRSMQEIYRQILKRKNELTP